MNIDRKREMFNVRIKWQVYNQQLSEINSYSYSCIRWGFLIKEQELMEEFVEFITNEVPPLPSELCNFFISKDIDFKINFRYIKGFTLKENLMLYLYYLDLKFQYFKYRLRKYIVIEGKVSKSIKFTVYFSLLNKLYFIQSDKIFLWLPGVISEETEDFKLISICWLFFQLCSVKYK